MEIFGNLSTEQNNERSANIELLSSVEILKRINDEDKKVANSVEKEIENICQLIDAILLRLNEKSRIIYVGAGTSGRLGVLDASECLPTYGVNFFKGVIAGGSKALTNPVENAEDDIQKAIEDLKSLDISYNDIVIGLAASGRTPYVISAIEYANSMGALTGSISCAKDSKISKISSFPIEVVVGPEIVTGSTRMKAGTAQKMVLNMISTTIMIKLGKVFSGYMVDVTPTNEKLLERAKNIISKITKCDENEALESLKKSNYDVKVVILMLLLKVDSIEAKEKLEKYSNNIARIIHEYTDKN